MWGGNIVQEKDIELTINNELLEDVLKNAENEGYRDINDYILHMISFSLHNEDLDKILGERFLKILYERGIERKEIIVFLRYSEGEEIPTISKDLKIEESEVIGLIDSIVQKFPHCVQH